MNETAGKENERQEEQPCTQKCPVASLLSVFGPCFDRESEAYRHLMQSRVELLKAVRSMVDRHIGSIEEKMDRRPKKASRIEVEQAKSGRIAGKCSALRGVWGEGAGRCTA